MSYQFQYEIKHSGAKTKELVVVLEKFSELLEFFNEPSKETAYWYGERALTGLLASAAWRTPHGWSLEEFRAPRDHGKAESAGRCDLWFGFEKNKKSPAKSFTLEAKLWEPGSLPMTGEIISSIEKHFRSAYKQLRQITNKEYQIGRPTVACYFAPYFRADDIPQICPRLGPCLTQTVEALSNLEQPTAAGAFWYDRPDLVPKYYDDQYSMTYGEPCLIIALQAIDRWDFSELQLD